MADYKVVDAEKLDADLTSVANAIREQTGKTDTIAFPNGFASAPTELVEVGRQKEWSDFWDEYQVNGTRTDYKNAFYGAYWNNISFKPKYDMYPTTAEYMFNNGGVSGDLVEHLANLGVTLDLTNCKSFRQFVQSSKITRVGVVGSAVATDVAQMFGWAEKLVTIDKLIVNENLSYSNTFAGCWALANLTMEGTIAKTISFSQNSKLTLASAKSVIYCLKNFTGTGTENTQTVSFHANTWGYLDAEGNASPDGKTWRDYITTTLCWNT